MGRSKQPAIRQRLLHACTEHVLEHGVPDRLAPLAAAAGTSPRMLLHHFTTKDGLLREVLCEASARQRRDFGELLRPRADELYLATLRRAWTGMTDGPARRYVAVFNPLREGADQRLWPGFRVEATTDWLEPLHEGLDAVGRPELATVVLAVIRGLLNDLEATEDRARVDQAWRHFVDLLGPMVTAGTVPG